MFTVLLDHLCFCNIFNIHIKYLKFNKVPSNTSMSISGCLNNWQKTSVAVWLNRLVDSACLMQLFSFISTYLTIVNGYVLIVKLRYVCLDTKKWSCESLLPFLLIFLDQYNSFPNYCWILSDSVSDSAAFPLFINFCSAGNSATFISSKVAWSLTEVLFLP